MFDEWTERQYTYQRQSFDIDLHKLTEEERLAYIDTMLKAAMLEIGEAFNEFSWKPWASNQFLNRDAVVGECVDVLFFIANTLAALGVSSRELDQKYLSKMGINTARQERGYDTGTTKCVKCKRALDDTAVLCTPVLCERDI